jgi:serine/threonine protein kinase
VYLRREVAILQDLRDANIVQFLGACLKVERPLLVTEFMQGGDLYDAINRDRNGVLLWYRRYASMHALLASTLPAVSQILRLLAGGVQINF